MHIPKQGFRHAVDLLLSNSVRRIPLDAHPDVVSAAAIEMAEQLVALAGDLRASSDCVDWIVSEYDRRLAIRATDIPDEARARAHAVLAAIGRDLKPSDRRNLLMLYAPEDRLPVAGLLAVELAKRGVTVAFAEGEVSTLDELSETLASGLVNHDRAVLLSTAHLARRIGPTPPVASERLLCVDDAEHVAPTTTAHAIMRWLAIH